MDTSLSASCLSLSANPDVKLLESRAAEVTSTLSLSKYESKSFKSVLPQIIAAIIAASFHIGNGISLAYSAVLIKQLDEPDSPIKPTVSEKSWMASVLIIVVPVASLICGFLMDGAGRLNTIKIAAIPGAIGWTMIALAQNVPVIIIGRLLIGFSSAWGTSPAIVYISEIGSTDLRGPLMSMAPTYVSLGMVLTYFLGWILDWRTLAWICNLFIILPAFFCMLIPESPAWLVWRGKHERAKKSLDWFSKYQPQPANKTETYAELQLKLLQDDQNRKKEEQKGDKGKFVTAKEFLKPTGYKPLIFFVGLFTFQHFSGIYITMFFSIQFIEAAGTKIDPYIASILIGFVRLFMSMVSTFLLKKFKRRVLLMTSAAGMAFFMFWSGLFTKWIQEGTTTLTWVPVACILLYVVSSILGMLPIPTMLLAELFPLEIRGTGYSIGYSIGCIIMFAALQGYYTLLDLFGGATQLQWFFAVTCVGGLVFSYIFLPETFGVKLTDVQTYFKHRTMYIGHHTKNNNNDNKHEQA